MAERRLITWHGRTQSLRAWSKEVGLNYGTVLGRFRLGIQAPDQLFGAGPPQHPRSNKYTCGGKTLTVKEWAMELGLTACGVAYRLRAFPLEIALDPGSLKVVQTIECSGEILSIAEWAKELGLTHQRIRQRLERYPVHVALSGIKNKGRRGAMYT